MILDLMQKRKSIREFSNERISQEDFEKIQEAIHLIPSAGNFHSVRCYFITGIDFSANLFGQVPNADIYCIMYIDPYSDLFKKYGDRAIQYAYLEAGHISQNIYLLCTELNIASVAIGAFNDIEIKKYLQLPDYFKVLYVHAMGKPKE